MTLFIISSLGALYFVMFVLISICFLAFLYTLVHSWCKWSQLELRNHQFCFGAQTVTSPVALGQIPVSGWGSPSERGLLGTSMARAVLEGLVPPKTHWQGLCTQLGLSWRCPWLPHACWRHPDVFVFNHEHPGVCQFDVTDCPPRMKTSPITSWRDGDFSLRRLFSEVPRSHLSARCELAHVIAKRGLLNQPFCHPRASDGLELSSARLGLGALPGLTGAAGSCPLCAPVRGGRTDRLRPPPAALPATFASLCRRKGVLKLCS